MAPSKRTRGSETKGKPIRKSTIRSAVHADEHYRFLKKNTRPNSAQSSTRKATRQVPARSASRKTKTRAGKQQQEQKPFPFLDLPAEMRNEVYEYDMVNCQSVRLSHRQPKPKSSTIKKFPISSSSGLVRVNRQIHDEYLGLATTEAPVTETEVQNFNFNHLIAYFNSLEETAINKMKESESLFEPSRKVFMICLTFNKDVGEEHIDGLTRWLNRLGDKTKQGSMVEMKYECEAEGSKFLKPLQNEVSDRLEYFEAWQEARYNATLIGGALLPQLDEIETDTEWDSNDQDDDYVD